MPRVAGPMIGTERRKVRSALESALLGLPVDAAEESAERFVSERAF